jgi:hypothetical protein
MRRAISILALGLGLGLGSPHLVSADEPQGPKAEGDYGGVQPGQPKKPAEPGKKPKKPPPKGTLSWIGFEMKDGGSVVFLQSVAPFELSQHVDKGTLVVNLSGVSRLAHNVWRPIDTRFFDTSLSRVVAKKKGRGVEVRISFKDAKDAAQASVRTATEADGMYYAYLSFAGGGAAPAPAEPTEPTDTEPAQ